MEKGATGKGVGGPYGHPVSRVSRKRLAQKELRKAPLNRHNPLPGTEEAGKRSDREGVWLVRLDLKIHDGLFDHGSLNLPFAH